MQILTQSRVISNFIQQFQNDKYLILDWNKDDLIGSFSSHRNDPLQQTVNQLILQTGAGTSPGVPSVVETHFWQHCQTLNQDPALSFPGMRHICHPFLHSGTNNKLSHPHTPAEGKHHTTARPLPMILSSVAPIKRGIPVQ